MEKGECNNKVGEGMEMCSKRHDDALGRRQEGKRLVLHLHAHLQQRLFSPAEIPQLPSGLSLSCWVEEKQCWILPQTQRTKRNTAKWPDRGMKAASPKPLAWTFLKGAAGVICPRGGPSKQHPPALHLKVWLSEPCLWLRLCQLFCFCWIAQPPWKSGSC